MIGKKDIYIDRKAQPGELTGETKALKIPTSEGELIGYALTPCGKEQERHPAILMLHGFPGICNNHDLAQLFRSAGFTVFVPNAPGSWGSGGFYSFDGIVRAAREAASYMTDPEVCETYRIDPDHLFLFGHSMGGFTAVNVARNCDVFRGYVFAAPCDLHWFFDHPESDFIQRLSEIARPFLKIGADLTKNAVKIHKEMSFASAYPELKDKNFCLIRCAKDQAIPEEILSEFEMKIAEGYFGKGIHSAVVLDTDHGFNDSKFETAETVVTFCESVF